MLLSLDGEVLVPKITVGYPRWHVKWGCSLRRLQCVPQHDCKWHRLSPSIEIGDDVIIGEGENPKSPFSGT